MIVGHNAREGFHTLDELSHFECLDGVHLGHCLHGRLALALACLDLGFHSLLMRESQVR